MYIICGIAGLLIGGVIGWFFCINIFQIRTSKQVEDSKTRANNAENRAAALEATVNELRKQVSSITEETNSMQSLLIEEKKLRAEAETERDMTIERLQEEKKSLDEAKVKLTDTFKALAGDTLATSTAEFLKLANKTFGEVLTNAKGDLGQRQEAIQGLVKPLSETLKQFEEHVRSIEKNRQEAYVGLTEQLKGLSTSQQQLQKETANLVTALRKPQVRGRWGEMTLRRVVELSGMSEHCDFTEQVTTVTDEGRIRPDLVVHLPAEREIVVDAKISLDAYLDAVAADTEEKRTDALRRHAIQTRNHMILLAGKGYWKQFSKTPEFVVMFIPGESFFGAAVDYDHALIEDGLSNHVVLATPTTFIALLQAVAYGWRQEQIAKNTQEISELGRQLYERMKTLAEYISDIGKGLEDANKAYNNAVGSLESRVLPAARRFKELGVTTGEEVAVIKPTDTTARAISAPELKGSEERS